MFRKMIWPLVAVFAMLAVQAPAGPPFQHYSEESVDEDGVTVPFTDTETGDTFKATAVWVRNKSTSSDEVYLSATTYTVTAGATYMVLEPGEYTILPPVYSTLEPGRTSIGLRCDTGETATVQVWGLR